jgi:hypothetical protein
VHACPEQHGIHGLEHREGVAPHAFVAVIEHILVVFWGNHAVERYCHAQDQFSHLVLLSPRRTKASPSTRRPR